MCKRYFLITFFFLLFFGLKAQVNTSDSLALVDMYNAMNGLNWINNTNWLTGPVTSWYGITVTNNRVSKIMFTSNKIIGNFSNSIGRLSELEVFYIYPSDSVGTDSNHIGQLPDSIGNLVNLEMLWLSYCNITGTIPVTIGNLTSLKKIIIKWNHLTGSIPSTISNLQNLQWLDFSANNLSGNIPTQIGNLSNLQYLALGWNHFTGVIPSELGLLSKLEELSLARNELSGLIPATLGNIDSLNIFICFQNQLIKSIPPELCNCSKLTWIDVSDNNMSGTIPPCFSSLPDFQLNIENNHFSGSVSGAFVNSNTFWLYAANNELDSLADFSQYCNQKYIDVRHNKMTFEDFEPQTCLNPMYWPQDSVLCPIDTAIVQGAGITLSSVVGGTANHYSWYKNGSLFTTNYNGLLQINNMTAADTGIYTCVLTNSIVTNLTLYRYPIHLRLDTNGVNVAGDILKENKITVCPVPAKNILTVDMELSSENNVCIEFFDISGKALLTEKYTSVNKQQSVIDISGFAPGIYFCKVSVGSDYSYHKIMVQ